MGTDSLVFAEKVGILALSHTFRSSDIISMSGTDDRVADETSPLVGPNRTDDDDVVDSITVSQRHHGVSRGDHSGNFAETKSSWYLFLLTLCIVGYVHPHSFEGTLPFLTSRRY